jgi:hypothetical protein
MAYSQPININFAYSALFTIAHFFPLVFFWLGAQTPSLAHVMSLSMSHFPPTNTMMGPCSIGPTSKEQATYPIQFMLIPMTQTTLDFNHLILPHAL